MQQSSMSSIQIQETIPKSSIAIDQYSIGYQISNINMVNQQSLQIFHELNLLENSSQQKIQYNEEQIIDLPKQIHQPKIQLEKFNSRKRKSIFAPQSKRDLTTMRLLAQKDKEIDRLKYQIKLHIGKSQQNVNPNFDIGLRPEHQYKKLQERIVSLQNTIRQNERRQSRMKQYKVEEKMNEIETDRKLELVKLRFDLQDQSRKLLMIETQKINQKVDQLQAKLNYLEMRYFQMLQSNKKNNQNSNNSTQRSKYIFKSSNLQTRKFSSPQVKQFRIQQQDQSNQVSLNEEDRKVLEQRIRRLNNELYCTYQQNKKLQKQNEILKLYFKKPMEEIQMNVDKSNQQQKNEYNTFYLNEINRLQQMIDLINTEKTQDIIYLTKQNQSLKENLKAFKLINQYQEQNNKHLLQKIHPDFRKMNYDNVISLKQTYDRDIQNDILRRQNIQLQAKLKGLEKQYLKIHNVKEVSIDQSERLEYQKKINELKQITKSSNHTQHENLKKKYNQLYEQSSKLELIYKNKLIDLKDQYQQITDQLKKQLKQQKQIRIQMLQQIENYKSKLMQLYKFEENLRDESDIMQQSVHIDKDIDIIQINELKLLLHKIDIDLNEIEVKAIFSKIKQLRNQNKMIFILRSQIDDLKRDVVALQQKNIVLTHQNKNLVSKIQQLQMNNQNWKIKQSEYVRIINQYIHENESDTSKKTINTLETKEKESFDEFQIKHFQQLEQKLILVMRRLNILQKKISPKT